MKKSMISTMLLALAALIWGIAFVAQTAGMEHVGPFTFNAVRMAIGFVVLLPVIALKDAAARRAPGYVKAPVYTKELITGGLLCGVIIAVASTLQQFGILLVKVNAAGKAGFITALYIVFVPVFSLFLFKKRVRWLVWLSVAIALAGMYLLCMKAGTGLAVGVGELLLICCAVVFTFHVLVIDKYSPVVDAVRMSAMQFLIASLLCGVCMFIFEKPDTASLKAAWLPIAYAGMMSCGVAYTLQILGQRGTEPTVASLVLSLESVFAVLAGWLLLSERLSGRELLGCALVFAAIILTQLPEKRHKQAQCESEIGSEAKSESD